jgi:hypothetical protein
MSSKSPEPTTALKKIAKSLATGRATTAGPGGAKRTARKREAKPKANKYRAKGRHIEGKWFASEAEATRYEQLIAMVNAGVIDTLETQVKYEVRINNVLICSYLADFRYKVLDDLGRTTKVVVEDVKGMVMDLYRLKKKAVEAQHGVVINEIPARKIADWAFRLP